MSLSSTQTRFVLINPSHAGNVGAVARAMKVMGFDDLVLVAPRWANVLRREETIQRASGALDVLDKCRIVETLDEALQGMTHLCATAMTPRDFGPPTRMPREHFDLLLKKEQTIQYPEGEKNQFIPDPRDESGPDVPSGMAFLFGSERFGMRNEDVYRCHVALSIPANPSFASLNLAAAVQVIAYEWRLALGGFAAAPDPRPMNAGLPPAGTESGEIADAAQVAGLLAHLEQALVAIAFLDPQAPKKLMPRLNQLFNRAQLTTQEVHILRGMAKQMLDTAARASARQPAGEVPKG
jgi:tRNA/rRNA methyltransferase